MTCAFKSTLLKTSPLWISLAVVFATQSDMTLDSGSMTQNLTRSKRPSEYLYGHYGRGPYCDVQGKRILSTHTYSTSKCIKMRCWLGTSYPFSEGCEDSDGLCHDVNSQWEKNCLTYTCKKRKSRYASYYSTKVMNILCKDHCGTCHKPGKFYEYKPGQNCKCGIRKDGHIVYRCKALV